MSADDGRHLRATVLYTDDEGTTKTEPVAGVSDKTLPRHQSSSGGGGGGGGSSSGGGGGGGGAVRDDHGNTPATATRVVLDAARTTATPGQFHAPDDVDYFEVLLPRAGLLAVETQAAPPRRGARCGRTGAMLARADGGGERQNFRVRTPVTARPVLVAVEGQGGQTGAYTLETRVLTGYLENPGVASFQSGIGVLSGWVCDADLVEMEIGDLAPQVAAYGTERRDTAGVCGDTDNGFGLLFNWNLLSEGEHQVVAYVDSVELGRATATVTTLGAGVSARRRRGMCGRRLPDARRDRDPRVAADQSELRHCGRQSPAGATPGRSSALTGVLENPGPRSFQSGVGRPLGLGV